MHCVAGTGPGCLSRGSVGGVVTLGALGWGGAQGGAGSSLRSLRPWAQAVLGRRGPVEGLLYQELRRPEAVCMTRGGNR